MSAETQYRIIAADGLEYGPINLAQLQAWVTEGRITREMKVLREDQAQWIPAGEYSELVWPGPPAVPVAPPTFGARPAAAQIAPNQAAAFLLARAKSSATWFYMIAALSAVNSVLAYNSDHQTTFIFGLGITIFFDAVGTMGHSIALSINVFVMAVFALFGYLGHKGTSWAFAVGMAVYLLDAGICAFFGLWLMAAVHAYVLYRLFKGFQACREAQALGA
jgi:hypothetical protein